MSTENNVEESDFQIDMKNAFNKFELLEGIYESLLYFINNAQMNIYHGDKVLTF